MTGAAAAAVALRSSTARIGFAVVYHRVGDRADDPAHHLVPALDRRLFEVQLRHLARWYRPVLASELLPAIAARRRGQRIPVAVTFDDDLEAHVRIAAPALERAGVPATFFVSGDDGGEAPAPWWDDLQVAVDRKLVDPDAFGPALSAALAAALSRKPRGIHGLAGAILELAPAELASVTALLRDRVAGISSERRLTLAGIQTLAARGFEIGFHTRRHAPLPALDDGALDEAVTAGIATLEQACARPVTAIAYPHGRADGRVIDAVARAGFEVGFTTTAAAIGPRTSRFLVGRMPPSFGSVGPFAAAISRSLLRVVRSAGNGR